jgi:hypothetical protein
VLDADSRRVEGRGNEIAAGHQLGEIELNKAVQQALDFFAFRPTLQSRIEIVDYPTIYL